MKPMSKEREIPKSTLDTVLSKASKVQKPLKDGIITQEREISKSSQDNTQSKEDKVQNSLKDNIQSMEGDTSKSSENTTQPKGIVIVETPEGSIHSNQGDIAETLEGTTQSKEGDIAESLEGTSQSKEGDIAESLEGTTQSKEGDIAESLEGTTQFQEENVIKISEDTSKPMGILIPHFDEDTISLDDDMVRVITGKEDFEETLKEAGEKLVAVDFSAVWCGPCRTIRPHFHSLSLRYDDVVFLEVDADDCEQLVQDLNILTLPTFQFYKKEEKVGEFSGALLEQLEASIAELK
ncbi:thioredoxin domain-containing protein 2 isoform X2 [Meriones unguiculatus]|uniref:thioredoxin domain-containing protein 2 isoform X2 n=1 Tax=Meriones unguiculatus TaxID=10047 RepID=UPI00293F3918|nr:thioredoxin domain-containing protein 2 isoform X2 [Meriones unguiculatus]